jgi:hypothetical protein
MFQQRALRLFLNGFIRWMQVSVAKEFQIIGTAAREE